MHETAERTLAALRTAPELVDQWLAEPSTDEREGISISPRSAAILVRQGRTIGYTSKIGYIATYLPFARTGAKAAWLYAVQDVGETVWPHEEPTPAQVLNWLQWHSTSTLLDILSTCYGIPTATIKTRDDDILRRVIGYQYQLDFFAANPEAYLAIAGRALDPTDAVRWREKLVGLTRRLARSDDQDPRPITGPARLIRVRDKQGARSMNSLETTATAATAETSDPKPAVVKKKVGPAATVTASAKGTKVTKATRKKAVKGTAAKAAAKPKAARTVKVGTDEYSKKKLEAQGKLKIGESYAYSGPNAKLTGKRVKVVGHEASHGGIHIEHGEIKMTVSPFALLPKEKATPKAAVKKSGKKKSA